ncbi:hypothetical protein BIW11_13246 [Tropilaelaps mercedesae]|uniref:Uncharacterized protein n=1 Tax=Tropilaelaps mercedesae TaxID=418985 RepID=A0A1V9X324_9ACAR|nr:hypothetical protein BIW11_13246 [Tropilaelaps mercedesae]
MSATTTFEVMHAFLAVIIVSHCVDLVNSENSFDCSWKKTSDPYLVSLTMYNDLMKTQFNEPRIRCENYPPACQSLKEIVSGNRSSVLAHFYTHALTICNLMRLQEWTKGNHDNASNVFLLRKSLVKNVENLSYRMTRLEQTQEIVYKLMEEDLTQVAAYERRLKQQQNTLRRLTHNVLLLQDIASDLSLVGSWWSYMLVAFALRVAGGVRLVAALVIFGLFWTAEMMVEYNFVLFPIDDLIPEIIQVEVIRLLSCLCAVVLLWLSSYHLSSDPLQKAIQKSVGRIELAKQTLRHI